MSTPGTPAAPPSAAARVVLDLSDVSRDYPGGIRALTDVTLRIARGEMVAVVGPSGSGKSTLLAVMGTLDRPTSGRVCVDGHDVTSLTDRQVSALRAATIGFVFQQFHLAPGVSALDNVADGLLYRGAPRARRLERAWLALERVGLTHRASHHPDELSGGERQRVAIARAVVGEPPVVLADEPTGNLDSRSGAGVMALLHELHASGATIVVVTHDPTIAAGIPRLVTTADGRVTSDTMQDGVA